jgi:hypothetical protein
LLKARSHTSVGALNIFDLGDKTKREGTGKHVFRKEKKPLEIIGQDALDHSVGR